MNPGSTGRIFISYRREETAYPAGWLYDRLADHFGADQIFKDVDSIELGDDFVQMITRAVGSCDVLLALIGEQWLTIADVHGRRRIDNPNDFVRLEIEAALTRNVRIIPILVDGASVPHADELPASLAGLARRQALELSPSRFEYDTSRLLKVLEKTLADVQSGLDTPAAMSTSAASQPDQLIEARQSQKQPEQAEQRHVTDILPRAPTAAPGDQPPGDYTEPPDQLSGGRSKWARRIALGVVVAGLIVALVVWLFDFETESPPSDGTAADTTSPAAKPIIFQDDFANATNGWDDAGRTRAGGHYKNGAYSVYAEPDSDRPTKGGAPRKASNLYPSAPLSLTVEVDAKAFAVPEGTAYGIGCRMTENGTQLSGYLFLLANDYVNISKRFESDPYYRELKNAPLPSEFKANGTNRLEIDCSNGQGDQDVSLVFRVNGQVAAETTDSKDPLTAGTVALLAEAYEESKEAVEVEFDNFVVKA